MQKSTVASPGPTYRGCMRVFSSGLRLGSLVVGLALVGSACSAEETQPEVAPQPGITITPPDPDAEVEASQGDLLARDPVRATNAREVIKQIKAAEKAIDDPGTAPAALARAGHLQQLAYRVLGNRPEWDSTVLQAMPARWKPVVRGNVASRREFRSMFSSFSDTLPAWQIVEPEPAADLRRHYRAAERRFDVDWEYLAAINLVETGMGRIQGLSVAGAQGPMQFIPTTWAAYGQGDINDPRDAIMGAGRYLAANDFAKPGGVPGALFRYNNSSAYVRGVTAIAEQIKLRPRAYLGYHAWRIYYLSASGDVLLPEGFESTDRISVKRYLEANPQQ